MFSQLPNVQSVAKRIPMSPEREHNSPQIFLIVGEACEPEITVDDGLRVPCQIAQLLGLKDGERSFNKFQHGERRSCTERTFDRRNVDPFVPFAASSCSHKTEQKLR
jgi:hypothetical protein